MTEGFLSQLLDYAQELKKKKQLKLLTAFSVQIHLQVLKKCLQLKPFYEEGVPVELFQKAYKKASNFKVHNWSKHPETILPLLQF